MTVAKGPAGRIGAAVVTTCILLTACGSDVRVDRSVAGAARRVDIPLDSYEGVAWLSDGEIVVVRYSEPIGDARRDFVPWRVDPNGSDFRRLLLPQAVSGCAHVEYRAQHRLLGGDLALLVECLPTAEQVSTSWIVRVIDGGSSTEILAPGERKEPLYYGTLLAPDDVVRDFAFSKDARQGIGGATTNCGTLVRLTRLGTIPIDITIGVGERSWNLKEQESADPSKGGCTRFGTATFPSSDPTFSKVAFWAEPDAVNREVFARDEVRADLMTIDTRTDELETLLSGITDVGPAKWSPTGRWIAFIGDPARRGFGLWLFEVATKRLVLIRSGHPTQFLDWSPDGDALVLMEYLETDNIDSMSIVPIHEP